MSRSRTYAYDDNDNFTHVVIDGDTETYAYSCSSTPDRLDSLAVAVSTDPFLYNFPA